MDVPLRMLLTSKKNNFYNSFKSKFDLYYPWSYVFLVVLFIFLLSFLFSKTASAATILQQNNYNDGTTYSGGADYNYDLEPPSGNWPALSVGLWSYCPTEQIIDSVTHSEVFSICKAGFTDCVEAEIDTSSQGNQTILAETWTIVWANLQSPILDLENYSIVRANAVPPDTSDCVYGRSPIDVVAGRSYSSATKDIAFRVDDQYFPANLSSTGFDSNGVPVGAGGGGSWGDEGSSGGDVDWNSFFDGVATHDEEYGACDLWGSDSVDGLNCIWSWIKYAIWPPSVGFVNLVEQPMEVISSSWPFAYFTNFYNAIKIGVVSNSECPIPSVGGATATINSVDRGTVSSNNLCDYADSITEVIDQGDNPFYINIFLWLALVGHAISVGVRFFRS